MEYLLTIEEVKEINNQSNKAIIEIERAFRELKECASKLNINVITPSHIHAPLEWKADEFYNHRMMLDKETIDKVRIHPIKLRKESTDFINAKCMEIATTTPIEYWGRTVKDIWGCPYHTCPDCGAEDYDDCADNNCNSDKFQGTEYCDECPMQSICTRKKRWSK